MEIYVFDKDLNPLGIIDTYSSLQWNRKYQTYGDFELVAPVNPTTISLLQKGLIIWPSGDPEAAFINNRDLKVDDTGQDTIDVKGLFLTGYLARRIPWNPTTYNGNAEAAMRDLVSQNAINPADSSRVIPHLVLGPLKGYAATVQYQPTLDPSKYLPDSLTDMATAAGLGYRILFNPVNRQLLFDVYQGLDRTAGQSVNPRAIFSRDFENILTQEFTDSDDNYRNVGLVAGTYTSQQTTTTTNDDGTTDTETTDVDTDVTAAVGTAAGLDRYEQFIDSTSVSSKTEGDDGTETYMNQSDYLALLASSGSTDLAQRTETQTFDATVNMLSNLVYKQDFDLGDSVTYFAGGWGVTVDTPITGISEVYEEQDMTVTPTFGNDVPTLLTKIKQMR